MEFITIRVFLVGLFCSATLGVEEWSWQRDSRLETLSKVQDEGKTFVVLCLTTMGVYKIN